MADRIWIDELGAEDAQILGSIGAALQVGSQLDAADRTRGYDPWPAIARQEAAVRDLARQLSGGFCRAHANLVQRLLACAHLHLAWASLQDEVERAMR